MPRPSKHLPRDHDGSTRKVRLRQRLAKLRRDRVIIDREIKKLEKLWGSVRPFHKCQRCGYEWRGMNPENVPKNCARCHSAGWSTPVKNPERARRPGDAANPNWGQPNRAPRKRLVEEPAPEAPKLSDYHGPRPITLIEPPEVVDYEEIGKASQAATEEIMRRALYIPDGLPSPPIFDPTLPPGTISMGPLRTPFTYEEPTQAPPALVLYRPRQPEGEPQPESYAMPTPPIVESAPTVDDLELMFPPVAIDLRIAAELGEQDWEDHVETDD